jgi:hypothetical protein
MYKLWRIFNLLAEIDDSKNETICPVSMDPEEVDVFVQLLGTILKSPAVDRSSMLGSGAPPINFARFVQSVETRCLTGKDEKLVSAAISEVFYDIIANVLKKVGFYRFFVAKVLHYSI